MEPAPYWQPIVAIGSPFLSFFAGVWLTDRIGLYSHIPRRILYLIAIPIGIVLPAQFAQSAAVTIDSVIYYGYMQQVFKFAMFMGTVMLCGMAVPDLFVAIMSRILGPRGGGPGGAPTDHS